MADPSAAPATPTSLAVRADSPFAARLSWESATHAAAGFEIEVKVNDAFVRAALVDPTERDFVHHLRLPGQLLVYRVRSFNARGASAPSPLATITMPEHPTERPGAKQAAMGPCIAPVRHAPKSSGCDPGISSLEGEGGHVVSNVPGAGNGCVRHLVGEYAGCTRDLGAFELQADILVAKGHADEGWPLLHAVAGAGQYAGAQILTLQFAHGRYTVADDAFLCGESAAPSTDDPSAGTVSAALEACAPPFESCQRDPSPLSPF
jgi:hypothetical protein